ncbi:cytochrome c5 family protein [Actinomyces sp. oral taxon 170 str. F0386]|nr:cytochrome c5 family protein [Actinomyces sp. oral taxon 170 str. F0386]
MWWTASGGGRRGTAQDVVGRVVGACRGGGGDSRGRPSAWFAMDDHWGA